MEPQIRTNIAVQLNGIEGVVANVVVSKDKVNFLRQDI